MLLQLRLCIEKPKVEMDRFPIGYDDRFGVFCFFNCLSDFEIMETSLIFQYVILGAVFIFACYSLFRILKKTLLQRNLIQNELIAIKIVGVVNSRIKKD